MFVRSGICESRASSRRRLWLGAAPVVLCALMLLGFSGAARADSPAVNVFPIPGARYAAPQTQIAFRGVPPSQFGSIAVTGSRSGGHSGTVQPDSDGRGGSYLPSTPFIPGEVVTVQTSLNIQGASNGTFTFTVASPAGIPKSFHWPAAGRTRGDVQTYRSRRDLFPPAVQILSRQRGAWPGDLFVSSQFGPVQDGPLILDPYGNVLWFKPLGGNNSASDFRLQTYQGQPVLTWWQGYSSAGVGIGEGVINNSAYQQIALVQAANGMKMDLHEFQITPQNTAIITAEYPVIVNASSVHGPSRQVVFDSVVQEIDIPTGLVLFQWDSLDHVPLNSTFVPLPKHWWTYFDYFHVNSVAVDDDGTLIISARNTWAAYKVSHQTGAMIWQLGGRHSSFRLAPGTYWAFQHDVRPRARNDQYMTLFDDSAGPPTIHSQSRAIKLQLNLKNMTAHQVQSLSHNPAISANYEGNDQQLPNFDQFVGWGQQPYFSEYTPSGRLVFDARFVDFSASYRAYRFQWSGSPATNPAVAASRHGGQMTVYASWNGATHIGYWRVLGGSSPTTLHTLTTVRKGGFETAITTRAQSYVEAVPLDYSRHVLGKSVTIKT